MCRPPRRSSHPNVPMAACAQHALVPFFDLWNIVHTCANC
jgi:hypothetical protein